ncbi:unnamed protein product [Urochloa humidicola]
MLVNAAGAVDATPESVHTIALLVFWCVWKSRNRMIFYHDALGAEAIVDMMHSHLQLWIHRAPRRIDTSTLLSWCSSLRGVT